MKTMHNDITGKTSESVQELGLYESDCCSQEMIFDRNDCFSRCPRCERRCEWFMLESLVTVVEFEMGDPTDWLDVDSLEVEEVAEDPSLEHVHSLIA